MVWVLCEEYRTALIYDFLSLQHLVHLSWLGDDELVSVQISSESLLEQLPPTLKLKKYGTG